MGLRGLRALLLLGKKIVANTLITIDEMALNIVRDYIKTHTKEKDLPEEWDVYIVWKCLALQNQIWIIGSDLADGMLYEVSYNGDGYEFYLDVYKTIERITVKL